MTKGTPLPEVHLSGLWLQPTHLGEYCSCLRPPPTPGMVVKEGLFVAVRWVGVWASGCNVLRGCSCRLPGPVCQLPPVGEGLGLCQSNAHCTHASASPLGSLWGARSGAPQSRWCQAGCQQLPLPTLLRQPQALCGALNGETFIIDQLQFRLSCIPVPTFRSDPRMCKPHACSGLTRVT